MHRLPRGFPQGSDAAGTDREVRQQSERVLEAERLRQAERLLRQAERLRQRVNEARGSAGLPPLAEDPRLSRLAQLKAEDLRRGGFWDHVSPTHGSPLDMLRQLGLAIPCVGENLACAPDPDLAHEMLMRSLEHRFNILYPLFTHLGVGVAPGIRHGTVYVELFAHLGVEKGAADGLRWRGPQAGSVGGNGP